VTSNFVDEQKAAAGWSEHTLQTDGVITACWMKRPRRDTDTLIRLQHERTNERTNERINHDWRKHSFPKPPFIRRSTPSRLTRASNPSSPGRRAPAVHARCLSRALAVGYLRPANLMKLAAWPSPRLRILVVVTSVWSLARPATHTSGRLTRIAGTRGTGRASSSSSARQYMPWRVECFVCRRRSGSSCWRSVTSIRIHSHCTTQPSRHQIELRALCLQDACRCTPILIRQKSPHLTQPLTKPGLENHFAVVV